MPALTGQPRRDWDAFAAVYPPHHRRGSPQRAAPAGRRRRDDRHGRHPARQPRQLGLPRTAGAPGRDLRAGDHHLARARIWRRAPRVRRCHRCLSPSVDPRSPAARAGVRPGDIITAVNGAPPFIGGMLTPGVISLLNQSYPQQSGGCGSGCAGRSPAPSARSRSPRPCTGSPPLPVTSRLLRGHIAYVADLRRSTPARPARSWTRSGAWRRRRSCAGSSWICAATAAAHRRGRQLLGAFEHGRALSYDCTITGRCTANYPDRTDAAAAPAPGRAHRPQLRLGLRRVRRRGQGPAPGHPDRHPHRRYRIRPPDFTLLDDGSLLSLPARHFVSADHEIINGIGVAPDYYLPYTAKDLATRHDPDITKALALLKA